MVPKRNPVARLAGLLGDDGVTAVGSISSGPPTGSSAHGNRGLSMSAYIVFTRENLRDQTEFETYSKMAGGTLAGHEAKPLVFYGKSETVEGAPIEGAVIVEFPTMEAAKAWYDSPAYREARVHRFKGADYRVFITEGL
jgi:uncharacterized protein (DUF1330 family)